MSGPAGKQAQRAAVAGRLRAAAVAATVAAAAVAVAAATGAAPALAQVTAVTIGVDGLACPFCAYSLEKQLRELPAVTGLVIHVSEGTATFAPAADETVDFGALEEAVRQAGFTVRDLRLVARGRIEQPAAAAGGPVLVSTGGAPLLRLAAGEQVAALEAGSGGAAVRVSGTVVRAGSAVARAAEAARATEAADPASGEFGGSVGDEALPRLLVESIERDTGVVGE